MDALEGKVERGVAAVVNQILNTRVRLLEVERKIKETEELEARLEALEDVLISTRGRFQDIAAEGLITFDELRAKLDGLEETRETARRELDALDDRRRRLADLEQDGSTLLETYTEKASRGLDYFTPEDRHQTYKKLRLSVLVHPGGDLEVSGVLREAPHLVKNNGTSRSTARIRRKGPPGVALLRQRRTAGQRDHERSRDAPSSATNLPRAA